MATAEGYFLKHAPSFCSQQPLCSGHCRNAKGSVENPCSAAVTATGSFLNWRLTYFRESCGWRDGNHNNNRSDFVLLSVQMSTIAHPFSCPFHPVRWGHSAHQSSALTLCKQAQTTDRGERWKGKHPIPSQLALTSSSKQTKCVGFALVMIIMYNVKILLKAFRGNTDAHKVA